MQAAANGEALAYLTRGSIEADPEGSRTPEDTSALARRSGPGQWASRDLTPPTRTAVQFPVGSGLEYKLFSPTSPAALLEPRSGTPLAPSASERTPYLRRNTEPPTYTPLVSGCPPRRSLPARGRGGSRRAAGDRIRRRPGVVARALRRSKAPAPTSPTSC